jgi:hypothetical protein
MNVQRSKRIVEIISRLELYFDNCGTIKITKAELEFIKNY